MNTLTSSGRKSQVVLKGERRKLIKIRKNLRHEFVLNQKGLELFMEKLAG